MSEINKQRFNKMVIILGIIILPLIYSIVYLKGFWDPYNHLKDVPVALVNLDKCSKDCKGTELINKLTKANTFKFVVTSKNKAQDGLINKKYYAVITIPSNFTESFDKASTKDRTSAIITYAPNTKTNYLASQIIGKAVTVVQDKLHNEVTAQVVDSLAANLNEVPAQTQKIEDALTTISDGTNSLNNGASQLKAGTSTLNTSYKAFDGGVNELANGITLLQNKYQTLNSGINKIYNSVHNQLLPEATTGVQELQAGIKLLQTKYKGLDTGINQMYDSVHNQLLPQVKAGVSALSAGLTQIKTGSNQLISTLETQKYKDNVDTFMDNTNSVYKGLAQLCQDATFKATYGAQLCPAAIGYTTTDQTTGLNGVETLKYGTDSLYNGAVSVNNGINTLAANSASFGSLITGVNSLDTGLAQLKDGSAQMTTGIDTLATKSASFGSLITGINSLDTGLAQLQGGSATTTSGINSLANGATTLAINSAKVASGINTLDLSVGTLQNGTNQLNSGVNTAKTVVANKISDTKESLKDLEGLSAYAKNPVKVKEKDYGNVNTYGVFFSPYFMSLSLWIGGILILIGLYYDPDKRFAVLGRGSKHRVLRLGFYNIIGVVQAILLGFILKASIGYSVTNTFLYYGSCILISVTFLSIIMFLFFNFKDVGKFLSIVLLVVQLASCGGTFPIETEPAFYKAIYNFMPMKYSVDLLRESFVNMNSKFIVQDVWVLIGILVVFGALILITGYLKTKKEKIQELIKSKKEKLKSKKVKSN